jgi:hypothetical protein
MKPPVCSAISLTLQFGHNAPQSRQDMADVTNQLRIDGVEDSELNQLILQFYGMGSEHSPDETVCFRQGEGDGRYALKLRWDGPRISSIETGSGFQTGDLEQLQGKIRSDLISTEQLIGRSILLSAYPVQACYRADSHFQIIPVPPTAPRMETTSVPGFPGHPFLLEFPFVNSVNSMTKFSRRQRIAFELTLLLNAVLAGSVTIIGSRYKPKWVIWDDASPPNPTYRYCQEGYSYEGFNAECNALTSIVDCEPMRRIDPQGYYGQPFQLTLSLQLPNSIDHLVSKYFSLSRDNKERFLRAAFWLHQSNEITSPSASFLSLIYAIDALVPPQPAPKYCSSCNQSVGNSLTQRFVNFLDDLVPEQATDPEIRKTARRELCRVRGDLAHGRDLLSSDKNAWAHSFNPQGIIEWKSRSYAATLAKLALGNWLLR